MSGQLGLEGMTSAEIRQMNEEFKAEDARYSAALSKALRWVATKDRPNKTWRWWLARVLLGITYEDAFHYGWFFGQSDGSYHGGERLRHLCQSRQGLTCAFGREKEEMKTPTNGEFA